MAPKKITKSSALKAGQPYHEGGRGKPASEDTIMITGLVALMANDAESFKENRSDIVDKALSLTGMDENKAYQRVGLSAKKLGFTRESLCIDASEHNSEYSIVQVPRPISAT